MTLEGRLKLRDDRAFQSRVDVAPMILVLGVPAPFVREGGASSDTNLAIDDQHAAVGPAVRAIQPPRLDGMVIGELATRVGHLTNVAVIETPTGTDPIEENTDFNSGASAFA